jgi:hypothetical protein
VNVPVNPVNVPVNPVNDPINPVLVFGNLDFLTVFFMFFSPLQG